MMLHGKEKVLLVKLLYMNEKPATIALRKFQLLKNVRTGKGPLTVAGLIKLVQRFEGDESLEDGVKSGIPSLRQTLSTRITAEIETLASESATRTSSAQEGGRRLGLPPSSIRKILH
ncbi:hypothetical protein NPIL_655631 [Nephila pilipes]|uniref:DUF4817 domain-containing protein n=1 Tax=Nephila pilipes TaxID=299642 RepID=A0A8X6J2R4_NEPPI|nr:hypothetical protein NPIL_655631 [Nephila pilipes]